MVAITKNDKTASPSKTAIKIVEKKDERKREKALVSQLKSMDLSFDELLTSLGDVSTPGSVDTSEIATNLAKSVQNAGITVDGLKVALKNADTLKNDISKIEPGNLNNPADLEKYVEKLVSAINTFAKNSSKAAEDNATNTKKATESLKTAEKKKSGAQELYNMIALLAEFMQMMQVEVQKGMNKKQELDIENANSFAKMYTKKAAESEKAYQKAQHKHHSFWDVFKKIGEAVACAVAFAIDPVAGLAMIAIVVAQETGGLQKALKGMATAFHSKILASVVMTLAVVAVVAATALATGGVGAAEEGAELAPELGEALGSEGADAAEGAATEGADSSESAESSETAKKPTKLKRATGLSMMSGGMMVSSTQLFTNIFMKALGKNHKLLAEILGGVTDLIVSLALGIGGGYVGGGSFTSAGGSMGKMMQIAPFAQSLGMAMEATGSIGSGSEYIASGKELKKLAPIEKAMVKLESALQLLQESQKATNKSVKTQAKMYADEAKALPGMLAGLDAEVEALRSFA